MASVTVLAWVPLIAKSGTFVFADAAVNLTKAPFAAPVMKVLIINPGGVTAKSLPATPLPADTSPPAPLPENAVAKLVPVTPPVPAVIVTLPILKVWPLVKSEKVTSANSVELVPSVFVIVGMELPLTMLPTLPLLVAVAVTTAPLLAPVVKPSAKVPLKLPLLKVAVVDAAAAAKADMPDFKLENAVANSLLVVVPVEVKVNPLSVKPCPADSCGKVMALVSLAPNALAAAPETPVTPKGLEGGVVSKPKPKSEPCTEVESYQTDKFLPSGVVSVKPPVPLSPATTPCTVVPALILSITY